MLEWCSAIASQKAMNNMARWVVGSMRYTRPSGAQDESCA